MSLQYNLMVGMMAVGYVRALKVQANNGLNANQMPDAEWNKLTDCLDRSPQSVRAQFNKACNGLDATTCLQQTPSNLFVLANAAASKKCGNCTEQDAVVIQFLKDMNVRPLDLMNLMPNNSIDHTFVVIGRLANQVDPNWMPMPACRTKGSIDTDPSTWGPDAVICDPWHDMGKVYPAKEIETKMFRGYNNFKGTFEPVSIWRMN